MPGGPGTFFVLGVVEGRVFVFYCFNREIGYVLLWNLA